MAGSNSRPFTQWVVSPVLSTPGGTEAAPGILAPAVPPAVPALPAAAPALPPSPGPSFVGSVRYLVVISSFVARRGPYLLVWASKPAARPRVAQSTVAPPALASRKRQTRVAGAVTRSGGPGRTVRPRP